MSDRFPHAWRDADALRAARGKEWDSQVFLPMTAWIDVACNAKDCLVPGISQIRHAQVLQPFGAWRPTQDIVRFDPDVLSSLVSTDLKGDLPVEILWRLPAWAIYIDAPLEMAGKLYEGFMAYLEEDMESGQRELRLLYLGDEVMTPVIIYLEKGTIYDGVAAANAQAMAQGQMAGLDLPPEAAQKVEPGLVAAINMLLYICSYGLADSEKYDGRPSLPSPKKVKAGWRLFPPDRPTVHVLGNAFGGQIRQARTQKKEGGECGSHAPKRPHIRRAHWHSFWTGPRKGERTIIARWLPPIAVAMGEDEGE